MARNLACLVAAVALIAAATPAMGSVEGTWEVQGNLKLRVKIQGAPAQVERAFVQDLMTFHPGGPFDMIDMGGTWTQTGNKFVVTLDTADIVALYEQELADAGLTSDVTVRKVTLKGKERPSGIKGKLTMKMGIFIHGFGSSGKVKARYKFTGVPVAPLEGAASPPRLDAGLLRQAVRELARDLAARLERP